MTVLFAPAHASKARKRVFAVLALLGAWAVLAISGATPALAHATVVGSDPAESSRLQTAPSKVTMTLSEDVTLGGFPRQPAADVNRLDLPARRLVGKEDHAVEAAGGENCSPHLVM